VALSMAISVAQIIGSVIRKTIYLLYFFAYRCQIGTMIEKATGTDIQYASPRALFPKTLGIHFRQTSAHVTAIM